MYRTWRQLPVLFSPMLHNEENADTDNYPTSLYVASARKSALCPHTGNGHLVTLNLMVTVMGRESCVSLHRTGGFRRHGLGHRLCFVIKSACLCRDGPPALTLHLRLLLAHLDVLALFCFLSSIVGHRTAGDREAEPSKERGPSGVRNFKSFGLESTQIKRPWGQRECERRAATNIYCVPRSMKLF